MKFNDVLTSIIKKLGHKTLTVSQFQEIVDTEFKEFEPKGPEIVLKNNLFRKLNKAKTVGEKTLVISESWSV